MQCWCLSASACFHTPATGQASFPAEQSLSGADAQHCLSSGIQPMARKESSSRCRGLGLSPWQCWARRGLPHGSVNGTQVTATVSVLRLALHSLGCAELCIHCKPQSRCRCCRLHQKWVGIFCKPSLASLALTYLAEKNLSIKMELNGCTLTTAKQHI